MDTFTWTPDYGLSDEHEPLKDVVNFGDNYEQVADSGLNPDLPKFTGLTFTGRVYAGDGASIVTFLKAKGATTTFLWTPPDGTEAKFRCSKWKRTWTQFGYTITADFYQVQA